MFFDFVELVMVGDLCGMIYIYFIWFDGGVSICEMVEVMFILGYEFLGMVDYF